MDNKTEIISKLWNDNYGNVEAKTA
jgi:hypothetical protein